uniref:DNA repair protein Rev1 C-terminal domain-containing protein n=2 Tax=Schizaphis graminum TaxID=13262 RepID=A0A2S2NWZ5_SCHGA
MNQLDIDPTELRGIGIQMNKLESRIVTRPGRIENFISNMKSEPKINHISLNESIDNDKIISTKVSNHRSHQSSTENLNKPKSVMDFFKPKDLNSKKELKTSNFKSIIPHKSLVNIKMSQVDPSFLDALPADLRVEIENELKSYENQNSLLIENENSSTMEVTMTEESSKLYQHVQIDQMKEFIEEWVVTENEPKICDNIMVSKYLCNLINDAKTEDAYEIIRKLYRLIKNKDDLAWKQSYFDILKNVQETMLNLYNAKMKVETTFK